ncbi:C3 and PZP-like alpha-2-macroglobulin domain-containing protein 8 isoform X6 [Neovison vison]|uniref:C3 and PZP-like alpha-2-macroglobulin domain-containing protein 8 isoform X6 n=1 Tax=Neovison vison TaxID=452646 RepID=UPI001CF024C3|nr:C3 and PZP-like alpha-2-macroglobulin domain-containing protein 8 isoform X6 [Neogale vison]
MWGALLVPLLWRLLLLLSPRDGVCAAPQAPAYLIAAPSVFRSGVEEVISVTIFNSPREVMVQAQLVAQGDAVAWSQGAILDKGTIKLKVPTGLRGQALLQVWGRSGWAEERPLFHNQTSVTVDSRGASVFIQTDKPVYKPQHRVLISIFTVTPNLRPVSQKLEAYILDPRGSRMMEWRHLEPFCCGVANMTFPLSDQPVLGEWFIFVEMQGHVYNKSFEVQKYVLPKFELLIDPPQYIRDLDVCEKGSVQARYTFGKPVSGTLTINMTVNGVGYYSQEVGRPVLRTTKIHGSQDFDICVKDMIPTDVPEHFRGTVSIWATVTSVDGSQQVAFDASTPVQRQLVDVRYSKDTRKQFKPGLSYVGKVELSYPDGSPAEGVTVQIRAELTPKDNLYTIESVSRGGLVGFEIPFIPMSAQHVWLETKVTALHGKPVGVHYLPSYLSLSSWYSPSQCYLQLQPPSRPLQVGEEAHFPVKSTCPCNFTLYYEVAARGNIVLSGQQPAPVTLQRSRRAAPGTPIRVMHLSETEPPPAPAAEVNVCVTSLRLAVSPSMVPLGRLLVFYVRENGEGVADSLQFAVETFFENRVSLTYSANETQPGEVVDLRVRAARGSCVCVTVVDKSVYLLRSGFQLTPAQVFQDLEEYDVSDAFGASRDDGSFWWPGLAARRRRRSSIFPWPWGSTKDSGSAFAETGLVVMTDLVSLNHRQDGSLYTDEAVPAFQPHTGSLGAASSSRQPPRAEKRKRTFFPETWIWHCLNISDPSGEETLSVQVPDSITSWVGEAVGLSEAWGLGVAAPALLKTFKPFFVDFTLPLHVVRGEQAKIPLSVYNYMGTCAEVYVKISVPKGIRFVGHPGKRHLTKKMCVASGEMEPTWVVLSFSDLGSSNITAKALAYGEASCCRDGKALRHLEESFGDRRVPAGRDHIKRSVTVEPEGAPRAYTYSAFFCPNGDVMGPTLNHLSNLLRLPFGCGEQNMIHFAPNIFVLKYLQKTRQLSPEVEQETTDYLVQGYQRQLTYRHPDGSYSAFGERDASGSMWLTAFVLKSFAQARSFIFIDPQELAAAKVWIVRQQRVDGSFPAVGRILNKDIQGGVHGTVPLTAYVVAALLETGLASEEERSAIARARHFLESSAPLATDPYSSALTTYALTLLRSPAAPAALRKLRSLAITQDGVTHWSLTGSRDTDKDAFLSFSDGVSRSVVSAEVEMTAYALLTYTLLGDVATALPVVKWLSQQRNALGGFSSTQDTCVALQALAEYAILSHAGSVNLTISLASTNLDYQETFELHRANQKVLQTAAIPSLPTGLFMSARGEGCCLMQIDVTYHVPDPVTQPAFQLFVSLQEPEAEPRRTPAPASSADDDDPAADQHQQEYQVTLEVCTRWLHAGSSNMAVLEVPLLSGFRVDRESLEQLLFDKHFTLKRYEVAGRRVLFYFDEIPSRCLTCVRFRALREHVVGRTSALPVSVYDYYEPAFEATRFYNVSARSPLAQELCAGPACNEVERAPAQGPGWSPVERGPVASPEEGAKITRCGCARDCSAGGDPVCGSNGVVYTSACHLQEAACLGRARLEPVSPSHCALEQLTPASASYSYDYDPALPDAGHLAAGHGHEVMDLEGEAEDSPTHIREQPV